jgi:hypothetical protein
MQEQRPTAEAGGPQHGHGEHPGHQRPSGHSCGHAVSNPAYVCSLVPDSGSVRSTYTQVFLCKKVEEEKILLKNIQIFRSKGEKTLNILHHFYIRKHSVFCLK